jgi:hypothetical protein
MRSSASLDDDDDDDDDDDVVLTRGTLPMVTRDCTSDCSEPGRTVQLEAEIAKSVSIFGVRFQYRNYTVHSIATTEYSAHGTCPWWAKTKRGTLGCDLRACTGVFGAPGDWVWSTIQQRAIGSFSVVLD